MKFTTTTSALFAMMVTSTTAFAPNTNNAKPATSLRVSEKSEALPFVERPAILDGTYAGDAGFDPFGFAKK